VSISAEAARIEGEKPGTVPVNQKESVDPMRMLRVIEFLSLDGVMQAPGAPEEDTEGGFQHGGWQRPYFDDVLGAIAAEGMAATDTYLFGRKTYEGMAAYWPTPPDDDPYARHLNSSPKYVASTTLRGVEWQNSKLIKGAVAEQVATLKEQPGKNIAVLGSGDLVQTLIKHDLVDEYFLAVFPIVLGSGKRLFRGAEQVRRLSLIDSKATSTGGVILTYRPA
jgi:dihydrofolate reductase